MFWFKKKPSVAAEPETDATPATDPEAADPKPSDTEPSTPKPSNPEAAEPTAAGPQVADPTPAGDSPPPSTSPKSPRTVMDRMNDYMMVQVAAPPTGSTDALNSQIVEAVEFTNAQTFSYAPAQIAIAPDMMISQAAGLVAQSAAGYFDGVSKLALAAQAVLLEQMTKNIVENHPEKAAEDALGALATDLLVGAAAAVAAAAGALEATAAGIAIDKIDESIAKYSNTLANRGAPPS
ncbi:hypothetical protein RBU55_01040 [Pseudomonas chlororaphis subsp. aurantiaca]|uniref:hypothetical protein n=1 Tax=Pseudomonas chlororaphis TaxID=587753 RepID=UPI0027DE26F3|nr:hypothetical protein [Pseudomonas chlororaphis]WMJ00169.1 hypothetical protein RBU55_01040 [Pseudomonas chlororaphis subsp. aurantiaca]